MPPFNAISRRSTPEIVFLKNQNSASKKANCIIKVRLGDAVGVCVN